MGGYKKDMAVIEGSDQVSLVSCGLRLWLCVSEVCAFKKEMASIDFSVQVNAAADCVCVCVCVCVWCCVVCELKNVMVCITFSVQGDDGDAAVCVCGCKKVRCASSIECASIRPLHTSTMT